MIYPNISLLVVLLHLFIKLSNLAESSEDGMNEEEDDASFHSCSSGNNDVGSLAMHVTADSARFPQGNLPPYVVKDPKFRLSWTMMTYGYNTKKNKDKIDYQCCMGIYKCPREGCNFVQNAVAPRKGRANGAKPTNAKGTGVCTDHKLQLEQISSQMCQESSLRKGIGTVISYHKIFRCRSRCGIKICNDSSNRWG